jgi:hypothetical protein
LGYALGDVEGALINLLGKMRIFESHSLRQARSELLPFEGSFAPRCSVGIAHADADFVTMGVREQSDALTAASGRRKSDDVEDFAARRHARVIVSVAPICARNLSQDPNSDVRQARRTAADTTPSPEPHHPFE